MTFDDSDSHELEKHRVVLSELQIPADRYMGNQDIREVTCLEGSMCLEIGERAFKRCGSLQKLTLPSTLETIGKNAFCLCTSLVSVSLQSERSDGRSEGFMSLKQIGYGAFFGCCRLCQVSIPSSVEIIEDCAFNDCTSLTELQLQDGLAFIGERAFEGCRQLRQVHIPDTVETIQTRAFARCTLLAELTLPEGLKTIAGRALEGCTSLEQIKIPSTVCTLHYSLFGQCSALVNVTLQDGLKTIGSHVFKTCTSLRRIRIPSTVESIGYSCFARCTTLREVQLSPRLMFLGDCAFACCRALWAIFLPRSLAVIGDSAFDGCSNLVTVELDLGMDAEIGEFAFCDCSSLTNIAIPQNMAQLSDSSLEHVGYFDGCESLLQVYGASNKIAKASAFRFKDHPIHEMCYHASITTSHDLQQAINCENNLSFDDAFGMTPFHLLLSSPSCRMDLLLILLDNYPSYTLGRKNVFGKRAADYLLGSDWTEDTRSLLKLALRAWTMDRLEAWGHESWREEISRLMDELLNEPNQGRREALLRHASAVMQRYERVEAASLLELWLWKMMMKCTQVDDRSGYRIGCGASFIVPVVLGWLHNVANEE